MRSGDVAAVVRLSRCTRCRDDCGRPVATWPDDANRLHPGCQAGVDTLRSVCSSAYFDIWERTAMISRIYSCGFFAAVVLAMGNIRRRCPRLPRPLEIYFIDVEGGAATLLVTPDRESILIDSGWPGKDDRDPKRIVHVLKDLARMRPARPSGHDPLAHRPLWRRGRAGHGWSDRPVLGPRAAGGCRMPAPTFRTGPSRLIPWGSPTARPAGASGKRSMPVIHCQSKDCRLSCWHRAAR